MSDCCDEFVTTKTSASRIPSPIVRMHDDCGYRAAYKGAVGVQFNRFMPVKAGTAPGTVEPSPTGVDAIGISDVTLLTTATKQVIPVLRHVAEINWADMAASVGSTATNAADWWAVHQNLAKIGIYVNL